MNSRHELRVDWCTHEAAKYAVEHWHYSKRMPVFKKVAIGVWENTTYVGCVLFGQGATPELGKRFGLDRQQVCELTRVALSQHKTPTTRIVAIAMKMLRLRCPNIRLVVSFADSAYGHHGGIYQGGNWLYAGESVTHGYKVNGRMEHPKTLHSRYGIGGQSIPWLRTHVDPLAERVVAAVKYRYLFAFDPEMRAKIEPLKKPYPKRAGSADSGTSPDQGEGDGASPIPALCEN